MELSPLFLLNLASTGIRKASASSPLWTTLQLLAPDPQFKNSTLWTASHCMVDFRGQECPLNQSNFTSPN